ncbi:MAG: hypothetical protein QOE90_1260 [Thermoplasmata archaeon]|nr:hypothetical protein [Thermoplasmata archaeon]
MFRHTLVTFAALALFAGGLSASGAVHAAAPNAPAGHITIHRFSNFGTELLVSPPLYSCVDIHTGTAVSAGSLLTSPNPGVSCVPSGSFTSDTTCYEVDAGGYHAAAGGGILTITSACAGLSVTQAMVLPFSDPGVSSEQAGSGSTPWTCTTDETFLAGGGSADFWVYCNVNVAPPCDTSSPNYQPQQAVHVFVVAGNFGATIDSQFGGVGVADVFDTSGCATGDGDNETGQGGAQFPETSQGACAPAAPVVGHHNGGTGATATIQTNTLGLPVDFTFGTDGQDPAAWAAGQACTGNNVVSDSYDTDPYDCGQGVTGHFPGTSATLAGNVDPHHGSAATPPDPDPWQNDGADHSGSVLPDPNGVDCFGVLDGSAWSFFVFGPSASGLITNPPLVSTKGCPVIGDSSSVGGGLAGTGLLTGPLAGNGECGLHGGVGGPSVGTSTPLQGTITAP